MGRQTVSKTLRALHAVMHDYSLAGLNVEDLSR